MKKYFLVAGFFCFLCVSVPEALFAASISQTIRSEATIKVILELAISEVGESELRFGDIQSSSSPTEAGPLTILINVTSNTGERYQVTQLLNSPLRNAGGDQIDVANLKFKTSSSKSSGTGVSSLTAVSASTQTIFVSDTLGSSDAISAEYTLTTPAFQAPGNYSAPLTYTVSAL